MCPKCGNGGSDAIARQHSLKTRINKSNLIRKKGRIPCYVRVQQLPIITSDYVRLREKYDHLYIYSHSTIMHCPQGIISAIFEAKDYCPVEWSDAIVRQLLSAKQWLTESRRITTAKCENSCPVEWSDDCCKTITACETIVDRNSTGSLLSICNVMTCQISLIIYIKLNRTWGIKCHFIRLASDKMQGMASAQMTISGDVAQ